MFLIWRIDWLVPRRIDDRVIRECVIALPLFQLDGNLVAKVDK
jgi:hypothetical protein